MAYNDFIPQYIKEDISTKTGDVITNTEWNRLFNLNIDQGDHSEEQLLALSNEIENKANSSTTDNAIKTVTFNESTGVFTFTTIGGDTITIDTALEKVAINFKYDPDTQRLILTLEDGSIQYIDLSTLISDVDFADTNTIHVDVANHVASFSIKSDSITDTMLNSTLIQELTDKVTIATSAAAAASTSETNAKESEGNAKTSETNAKTSETNAKASADSVKNMSKTSESWAVGGTGTREGEDTNNAKYWCEQAEEAAGGDFLTKTGDASNTTAAFTEASVLNTISTDSKLTDLFGMIAKAIRTLILHIADKNNPHDVKLNQIATIDAEPITGSGNLVTSGGVADALDSVQTGFTGTKAEVQAAIASGEIIDGDHVTITDDYGAYGDIQYVVGTKAEVDAKIAAGEIANGAHVSITDDSDDSTVKASAVEMDDTTLGTTAEEAISSLNTSLSVIEERIEKTNFDDYVDVSSYSSASNLYTVPKDGYIILRADVSVGNSTRAKTQSGGDLCVAFCQVSMVSNYSSSYVRKGMKLYFTMSETTYSFARFIGLS